MEAMVNKLPVICSDIRGNNDLVDNKKGGHRVLPHDVEQWTKAIKNMIDRSEMKEEILEEDPYSRVYVLQF